jgi:hypothetical protein
MFPLKNDSSVYGILLTRRFDATPRITKTVNKERNLKMEFKFNFIFEYVNLRKGSASSLIFSLDTCSADKLNAKSIR